MKMTAQAGLAAAALSIAAAFAMPATAADLGGWGRGSIKDDYGPRAEVSPCYFRTDVGYSFSNNPTLRWSAVTGPGAIINERVTHTGADDTWTGGVGAGCSTGSRGFRYEFMLGYHGTRGIDGKTGPYAGSMNPTGDPIHSAVTTYTSMVNGYFDLGNFRGVVPYIGAGVGLAYHQMDEYTLPDTGTTPVKVTGANDLTLAWSAMAGIAYQISDRAILDLGYRYIDLGRAATSGVPNNGPVLSRLSADDITAHEIKIGLRYHFGGAGNCCQSYMPMK